MNDPLAVFFIAAAAGAISGHLVAVATVGLCRQFRRRTAYAQWARGADEAYEAHPLSPSQIPVAEPKAIDLDAMTPDQQTRWCERMGISAREVLR